MNALTATFHGRKSETPIFKVHNADRIREVPRAPPHDDVARSNVVQVEAMLEVKETIRTASVSAQARWNRLKGLFLDKRDTIRSTWEAMRFESRRRILATHIPASPQQAAHFEGSLRSASHVMLMLSRCYPPFDWPTPLGVEVSLADILHCFVNPDALAEADNLLVLLESRTRNLPVAFFAIDSFIALCVEATLVLASADSGPDGNEDLAQVNGVVLFELLGDKPHRVAKFTDHAPVDSQGCDGRSLPPRPAKFMLDFWCSLLDSLVAICLDIVDASSKGQPPILERGAKDAHATKRRHPHDDREAFTRTQAMTISHMPLPHERLYRDPATFKSFVLVSLFDAKLAGLRMDVATARKDPEDFMRLLKPRQRPVAGRRRSLAALPPDHISVRAAMLEIDADLLMWQDLHMVGSAAHDAYQRNFSCVALGQPLPDDLTANLLRFSTYLCHYRSQLFSRVEECLRESNLFAEGAREDGMVDVIFGTSSAERLPGSSTGTEMKYLSFFWLVQHLLTFDQSSVGCMWVEMTLTELFRLSGAGGCAALFPARLLAVLADLQVVNLALSELTHFVPWSSTQFFGDDSKQEKYASEVVTSSEKLGGRAATNLEGFEPTLSEKIRAVYLSASCVRRSGINPRKAALEVVWRALDGAGLPMYARETAPAQGKKKLVASPAPRVSSTVEGPCSGPWPGTWAGAESSATSGHRFVQQHQEKRVGRSGKRKLGPLVHTRGTSPEPDLAQQPVLPATEPSRRFKVDKKTLSTFQFLLGGRAGKIPWKDFEQAMSRIGFSVLPAGGSAVCFARMDFDTIDGGKAESIIFHRPHSSRSSHTPKIDADLRRRIGNRLGDTFGWTSDSFCTKG